MGTGSYNIIPENENHCVWMDAGLVNYKLCDKNFECESCPFDSIMQSQNKTFAERASEQCLPDVRTIERSYGNDSDEKIVNQLISPLKNIAFPTDRLYCSSHFWIQDRDDGIMRIGIDEFLAKLLRPIVGVALVHTPSRIEKDEPYAWLIRDAETFALYNPILGITATLNSSLTSKPSLLTNDPYGEGWLLSLIPSEPLSNNFRYVTSEEHRNVLNTEIDKISRTINSTIKKNHSSVGSTMRDGGMRIETIEQFIGKKQYTKLLLRLLRPQ
jgi:glycine cleavage system H lipoate-binding protein